MGPPRSYWDYAKYSNIALAWGIATIVYILVGYYGGSWLDHRWNTAPVFAIIGVVFGVATSFKHLWDDINEILEQEREDKKKRE